MNPNNCHHGYDSRNGCKCPMCRKERNSKILVADQAFLRSKTREAILDRMPCHHNKYPRYLPRDLNLLPRMGDRHLPAVSPLFDHDLELCAFSQQQISNGLRDSCELVLINGKLHRVAQSNTLPYYEPVPSLYSASPESPMDRRDSDYRRGRGASKGRKKKHGGRRRGRHQSSSSSSSSSSSGSRRRGKSHARGRSHHSCSSSSSDTASTCTITYEVTPRGKRGKQSAPVFKAQLNALRGQRKFSPRPRSRSQERRHCSIPHLQYSVDGRDSITVSCDPGSRSNEKHQKNIVIRSHVDTRQSRMDRACGDSTPEACLMYAQERRKRLQQQLGTVSFGGFKLEFYGDVYPPGSDYDDNKCCQARPDELDALGNECELQLLRQLEELRRQQLSRGRIKSREDDAAMKLREEAEKASNSAREAMEAARLDAQRAAQEREEAERAAKAAQAAAESIFDAQQKRLLEDMERDRLEAERQQREEEERIAQLEAEREARREAERLAREAQQREEQERRAREDAERKAQEAREREEAERRAREEAEREAQREIERQLQEAREREERERLAREEAERVAQEALEREEAERRAREEAERLGREEAERLRQEALLREEAARQAQEESERRMREEAEERAREEEERRAREEEERARRVQEEIDNAVRAAREEEARRRERDEAEHRRREEAQRRELEEAVRRAKQEAEERARQEDERRKKEEAIRRARDEADRREHEEQLRRERLEAERREREESERRAHEDESEGRSEFEGTIEGESREDRVRRLIIEGRLRESRVIPNQLIDVTGDNRRSFVRLVGDPHVAAVEERARKRRQSERARHRRAEERSESTERRRSSISSLSRNRDMSNSETPNFLVSGQHGSRRSSGSEGAH